MATLNLTKHHGSGNDFLVLLDLDGGHPVDAGQARALCDRHRGIGADGVIRVTAGTGGAEVTMELRNADGGVAEISGNGLRCVAQAVLDAGLVAGP
ncbi:MAG: diaminopimelate epimerase, partial [Acidimicrobiales bacterium]